MSHIRRVAAVGRAERAITAPRLSPFYDYLAQPKWEALAKYAWNIAICEAFYPLLNHIEVVLRNAIDRSAASVYSSRSCVTVQGSWLDATPSHLSTYGQEDVLRAKSNLLAASPTGNLVHGQLVAALDFGFWTGLLSGEYVYRSPSDRRLWPQLLTTTFPQAPASMHKNVAPIANAFNDVRHFRNRVFHYEPVFKLQPVKKRAEILDLISWISPETSKMLGRLDRLTEVISDDFRRRLRVRIYRELSK